MSDITGVVSGMAHMRILIGHGDPDQSDNVQRTTWGEFCVDNADTLDMLWECRRALVNHGRYVGGGGAAPVFTVSRASSSATLDRLIDLTEGWLIVLDHDGTQWTLTINAKRGDHTHQYTSTDLTRLINHAWAGAPGGRV